MQKERERQKEEQVEALKLAMQSGQVCLSRIYLSLCYHDESNSHHFFRAQICRLKQ